MARVYETLRRARLTFTTDPSRTRYLIRLWLDAMVDTEEADNAIAKAVDLAARASSTQEAAESIANRIEGLNAVEVLDGDLNGSLVYPEWP